MDLRQFGVELVMVFDGAPMPCKKQTEDDRKQNRIESLVKAEELDRLGKSKEAEKLYSRAVDVTPQLAKEIIEALQSYSVECIVAPYEADAQLAYLSKIGYISGVISEDSDLIVFESCKILYKLEPSGNVKEFCPKDLQDHPVYNLRDWSHDRFIQMCVLSGCDYLKSVKSIGIKTAYKYVSQNVSLQQIISKLKREIGNVPSDYEQQFNKAVFSFKYHQVFCPIKGKMVNLNSLPEDCEVSDLQFLGETYSQEIMIGIARGRLDPCTKEPFDENHKRKMDEIYQPIKKQIKKVQVAEEIKSLVQRIRVDKKTTTSKYFNEDEILETEEKTLILSDSLKAPFKAPYLSSNLPKPESSESNSLSFIQTLNFEQIDLVSIFNKGTN
jgi:exonuclease-1